VKVTTFAKELVMVSGRERVRAAMALQKPGEIPVMCQLSIGHILLNTSVDPIAFNFTNEGFAKGLLEIRDRYNFDGILIHKPGREEQVLEHTRQQISEGGVSLIFADGGEIFCQFDDDPQYLPPEGFRKPSIADFNFEGFVNNLPSSLRHWWLNCGLLEIRSLSDVPDFWYGCIEMVQGVSQGRYSIHGEVNSPFDAIFHLLEYEEVFMGLITHPEKIHSLLDRLTQFSLIWAVAQVRRGCDAIKLSSPWAGSTFISRKHYQTFVLPFEKRIVEAVHQAGGVIYTHTCGAIDDRLDLIVESGVDGIECLDPPPLGDVDLKEAVESWGDRIFIKGNVDSVHTLLEKSPKAIRVDANHRLAVGSQGRGFILSTACSVAPHVPPENVSELVEAARAFKAET
jgi:hypothetical protein